MRPHRSCNLLPDGDLPAAPLAAPGRSPPVRVGPGRSRAPALLFLLLSLMLWRVEGLLLASWIRGTPPRASKIAYLPTSRDQQRLSRQFALAPSAPGGRPAIRHLSPAPRYRTAATSVPTARDRLYLLMSLQR
jgi:hypothetical protein